MAFSYKRQGNGAIIEVNGTIQEIATEVTYMVHKIYSAFYNQNPALGGMFKASIMLAVSDEHSPIWDASQSNEGEISALFVNPNRKNRNGEGHET